MKSQPDTTIRRIAVLTGYGDRTFDTAFTGPIRRRTSYEPQLRPGDVFGVAGLMLEPAPRPGRQPRCGGA